MSRIEVLSVDPGEKTLGALHPEVSACLAKGTRAVDTHHDSLTQDTVDFLTAVRHPSAMRLGGALLLLRCLFGAMLIVSGAFAIDPEAFGVAMSQGVAGLEPFALALAQIVAGSLLCLGCGVRLTSIVMAAVFGAAAFNSLAQGAAVMGLEMMLCFGCVVFAVLGGGRISVDGLVYKSVRSWRARRNDPSRLAAKRLSYEAFKYSAH